MTTQKDTQEIAALCLQGIEEFAKSINFGKDVFVSKVMSICDNTKLDYKAKSDKLCKMILAIKDVTQTIYEEFSNLKDL